MSRNNKVDILRQYISLTWCILTKLVFTCRIWTSITQKWVEMAGQISQPNLFYYFPTRFFKYYFKYFWIVLGTVCPLTNEISCPLLWFVWVVFCCCTQPPQWCHLFVVMMMVVCGPFLLLLLWYTLLLVPWYSAANFASVADVITCLMMCAMLSTAPLLVGIVASLDRRKCPPALLCACGSLRLLTLLCSANYYVTCTVYVRTDLSWVAM